MSGLWLRRSGIAVVAIAGLAVAAGAGRDSGMSLKDARKDYEAAKKKYESELARSITKAQRDGDEKTLKDLSEELSSLNAGFDVRNLKGTWRFDYNNNTSRTYVFAGDGSVAYAEERAIGKVIPHQGGIHLKFAGRGEAEILYVEPTVKLNYYSRAADLGRKLPDYKAIGQKLH